MRFLVPVLLVTAALAGCFGSDPETLDPPPMGPPVVKTIVYVQGFKYTPDPLRVLLNASVEWTNQDSEPHTATSSDGVFDSGTLARKGTFTFNFTSVGTFPYFCAIHPNMTATVQVFETVPPATTTPEPDGSNGTAPPTSPTASAPPTSPTAGAEPGATATIRSFKFAPASFTVAKGTRVAWTNEDATAHTVTADGGSFDSGALDEGATFATALDTPGTFAYKCRFHPSMTGTVTVTEETPPPAPETHVVAVSGFKFSPGTIDVNTGDTVRWTNQDAADHTVTSTSGAFDSGRLDSNESFAQRFTVAGTYSYLCDRHPSMTGTVVVRA